MGRAGGRFRAESKEITVAGLLIQTSGKPPRNIQLCPNSAGNGWRYLVLVVQETSRNLLRFGKNARNHLGNLPLDAWHCLGQKSCGIFRIFVQCKSAVLGGDGREGSFHNLATIVLSENIENPCDYFRLAASKSHIDWSRPRKHRVMSAASMFGAPLASCRRREGIPQVIFSLSYYCVTSRSLCIFDSSHVNEQVVYDCVENLRIRGLRDSAIFVKDGVSNEIEALKSLYDDEAIRARILAVMGAASVYSVAHLLKDFLKEMKQPLISPTAYPILLKLALEKKRPENHLRVLVASFPDLERVNFRFLFRFLAEISYVQGKQKLGSEKLAKALAPCLVRTKSSLKLPDAIKITKLLIDATTVEKGYDASRLRQPLENDPGYAPILEKGAEIDRLIQEARRQDMKALAEEVNVAQRRTPPRKKKLEILTKLARAIYDALAVKRGSSSTKSFIGRAAIDFILENNIASDRESAVQLGFVLMRFKIVKHVTGRYSDFRDEQSQRRRGARDLDRNSADFTDQEKVPEEGKSSGSSSWRSEAAQPCFEAGEPAEPIEGLAAEKAIIPRASSRESIKDMRRKTLLSDGDFNLSGGIRDSRVAAESNIALDDLTTEKDAKDRSSISQLSMQQARSSVSGDESTNVGPPSTPGGKVSEASIADYQRAESERQAAEQLTMVIFRNVCDERLGGGGKRFIGKKGVDFLVGQSFARDRAEAVALFGALMDEGLVAEGGSLIEVESSKIFDNPEILDIPKGFQDSFILFRVLLDENDDRAEEEEEEEENVSDRRRQQQMDLLKVGVPPRRTQSLQTFRDDRCKEGTPHPDVLQQLEEGSSRVELIRRQSELSLLNGEGLVYESSTDEDVVENDSREIFTTTTPDGTGNLRDATTAQTDGRPECGASRRINAVPFVESASDDISDSDNNAKTANITYWERMVEKLESKFEETEHKRLMIERQMRVLEAEVKVEEATTNMLEKELEVSRKRLLVEQTLEADLKAEIIRLRNSLNASERSTTATSTPRRKTIKIGDDSNLNDNPELLHSEIDQDLSDDETHRSSALTNSALQSTSARSPSPRSLKQQALKTPKQSTSPGPSNNGTFSLVANSRISISKRQ
eukprot:jgi/Bigna1/135767/aug1.31_g10475